VVGKTEPVMVSEKYLSEIIEARLGQIFKRLNGTLQQADALQLPGGIVITGGTTAIPGIVELAQDIFGRDVKRYIPDEMGLRHPAFTQALGLIQYAAGLTDIDLLVGSVTTTPTAAPKPEVASSTPLPEADEPQSEPEPKKPSALRRFFGNFFE
jgi:cell division protein FtsA